MKLHAAVFAALFAAVAFAQNSDDRPAATPPTGDTPSAPSQPGNSSSTGPSDAPINDSAQAPGTAASDITPPPNSVTAIGLPAPGVPYQQVSVKHDPRGFKLQVDGVDTLVVGVNWDYVPIGQNYRFSLWEQPDQVIETALAREMPMLQRMGINAIRQYVGVPARWVKFIYEKYGIFTVLNPTIGRYGSLVNGVFRNPIDYSDEASRAALTADVVALVREYRNTPGILMWLLGNENNYGLTWQSFEIEALPKGDRDVARARYLYSLFGQIIKAVKAEDTRHPVAIANGDVQYIDVIAQECQGLDIFGTNVYRGMSARDLFSVVQAKLSLPVMFTEFGADAYDAAHQREDDVTQAKYLVSQWREIYEQSYGKGQVGNAIGGMIFQWADGWWKFKQESNLEVHDTSASWPNAAYAEDFVEGQNNMNEEWWGICAKGPPDPSGLYELQPRTAYYALQAALRLPPYGPSTDLAAIRATFGSVDVQTYAVHSQAEGALRMLNILDRARVTGLRMQFDFFNTGGQKSTSAVTQVPFDHMQSFFADFQVRPLPQVTADLSLNILGNVAQNPIDQIYYEKRGKPVSLTDTSGMPVTLANPERVKVYKANVTWDEPWFSLTGFFRTGHYHWGYEGDFFGLYREANYGTSIDTYNADVPIGLEIATKRELDGFKLAVGPQVWWGANPLAIAKYTRAFGPVAITLMDEEQFDRQRAAATSTVVPEQRTRKTALSLASHIGPIGLELGGLWSGSPKIGQRFLLFGDQNQVLEDHVSAADTLGAKLKLTLETGRIHAYVSSAYMGLVADGGPTAAITYTGWSLKDSGSGNQVNALAGVAIDLTPFQLAPNFIWQKPLVGAGPSVSSGSLRNILADPFVVRSNREMIGGEMLVTFDPTPGTWLWAWDNELTEDAPIAASLDVTYKHMPTSPDAAIGIFADGSTFPFPGSTPPRDLWEAQARIIGHPSANVRIAGRLYVGTGEPNGDSQRVIHRYGGDVRLAYQNLVVAAFAKFNDWGPYDYYKDFNLTFPLQLMGDVSYTLGTPRWLGLQQARFGVRGTLRYLNGFSANYVPDPMSPNAWGNEYEVRTYLVIAM